MKYSHLFVGFISQILFKLYIVELWPLPVTSAQLRFFIKIMSVLVGWLHKVNCLQFSYSIFLLKYYHIVFEHLIINNLDFEVCLDYILNHGWDFYFIKYLELIIFGPLNHNISFLVFAIVFANVTIVFARFLKLASLQ